MQAWTACSTLPKPSLIVQLCFAETFAKQGGDGFRQSTGVMSFSHGERLAADQLVSGDAEELKALIRLLQRVFREDGIPEAGFNESFNSLGICGFHDHARD